MLLSNFIRRPQLADTTSGREGALLVGTDSKTNLGSATTVEAALTSLNTFVGAISETIDDRVNALFVAGTSITLTYDDTANTFTVSVASHTHTASQITDFAEAVDDRVNALFVAGTNITLTYNDGAGTFTIDAAVGSHTQPASTITDFAEAVDDRINALFVAGTSITLTYDDTANTFTVSVASHTHTASQITDFAEAVDDRVNALFVAGSNITLTYNDVAGTFTIAQTAGTSATLPLIDGNGNEWLTGSATTSAVNHFKLTNAATGNAPKLEADGDDTDVDFKIGAKGAGTVNPISPVKVTTQLYPTLVTASDGATVTFDASLGNYQQVTLGGNRTLVVSNALGLSVIRLRLLQDGTGGRTITWDGSMTIKWAGGSPPTIDTTANKATWIVLIRTGSNAYDGAVLSGPH